MSRQNRKRKAGPPAKLHKPEGWLEPFTLHPKKRAFLLAFSRLGTVTHATRTAGIAASNHYDWLSGEIGTPEEAAEYKKAFEIARQHACDTLEAEARRRASEGVDKPVYYKGEVVGTVKEYSDLLLIFLLKGAMPEKYRERIDSTHEVTIHLAEEIKKARARVKAQPAAALTDGDGPRGQGGRP